MLKSFAIAATILILVREICCWNSSDSEVECPMGFRYRSKSNGYIPVTNQDVDGNEFKSLQDFLEGNADYVTLALDSTVDIPRGTPICIPEFNRKYKRNVVFQYRDSTLDLEGRGYSQCRICVRDRIAKHAIIVNQYITLVVPKVSFIN